MDIPHKIGRYEILEELGRGAMGTVYRAKDPAMDRVVALKTIISVALESQHGSEFRERFYREARAAGALAHPGIVPVFDVGEHEGTPFLVMEFISGQTLADRMKKGERLRSDRICEMGQKIAEALGYAHQHKVVHRDIKPANILLTSREVHGIERPKITDFGVAKLAEGQSTLTGQMVGTPAFMPPEQFTGAPIDGRADIYSLGVVLYWLATGEQPFPGESMTAVSYKVVHTDPVPPQKLNPSIPSKLERVILKCLAKSPAERYQTGEELARDLGELRTGENPATVQMAAPQRGGSDLDATIVEPLARVATAPVNPVRQPEAAAVAPAKKSDNRLAIVLVAAIAVAAGGWYLLRSRQVREGAPIAAAPSGAPATPAAQTTVPAKEAGSAAASEANTPPAKAETEPASTAATASNKTSSNGAKNPEIKAETKVNPSAPPVADAAASQPAALDFDPRALDPKQNARLKIDAEQMPAGLDFTVEMNGKLYFQKSGAEGKAQDDKLFVPPGVQEFRVTARSGALEKGSNTVSMEFKAKKRNTLKIELRLEGKSSGAGVPKDLYPGTQIVATLK